MKSKFPIITHIDDVLPHLVGFDEFKVMKKDGYQVISYNMQISSSFGNTESLDVSEGDLIRRECRGLTFDMDGNLIGRKFHKFFNVGERLETMMSNVDLSEPHVILEKIDGSMVVPIIVDDELQWHTKAGNTAIGQMASKYVNQTKDVDYESFAIRCFYEGYTTMFEYCSRNNRVVLDYPEDKLILTAIRVTETGLYLRYDDMVVMAKKYNIPVVGVYKSDDSSIEALLKEISTETGIEGIVLRFNSGHMCKIKCDEYILFHRTVSEISQEKNIWRLIAENKIDDIKSALSEDVKSDIEKFESKLQKEIVRVNKEVCDNIMNWVNENKTTTATQEDGDDNITVEYTETELKKMFAEEVVSKVDERLSSVYFSIRNRALKPLGIIDPAKLPETKVGKPPFEPVDPFDAIAGLIIKNSNSNTRIEYIRSLFGNIKWSRNRVEDEE